MFISTYLAMAAAIAAQQLQIGVKFKPQECAIVAENGDLLSMHYTGFSGL